MEKSFSYCDGSIWIKSIYIYHGCSNFWFHFTLQADVNTVCFADETGHLIYSGSDDSFCKVCSTIRWLLLLCYYHLPFPFF